MYSSLTVLLNQIIIIKLKIEKLLSDLHRKSVMQAFDRIVTVEINVKKIMLTNSSQILLPAKRSNPSVLFLIEIQDFTRSRVVLKTY